jgi:hypothetical protein
LLAYLDSTVGRERYTLVVSADHGVCPLPEQKKLPEARRVMLTETKNEVFPPLAAALDEAFAATPGGPTRWFEVNDAKDQERVWPWVYLNRRAIEARGLKVEGVSDLVRDWLGKQPFIETAFTRKQLETETFPPESFGAKAKLAYHPDRCGEVIAIPKSGVLVTPYPGGTNHGSPQPYDSHVPVLATGGGIPGAGTRSDKVSSLIVARILAKSLGIDPPKDAVPLSPEITK